MNPEVTGMEPVIRRFGSFEDIGRTDENKSRFAAIVIQYPSHLFEKTKGSLFVGNPGRWFLNNSL